MVFEDTRTERWFALYVRSRFEKKVHAGLVEIGVETFLPLIEELRLWSDRKKKVMMPLFPGYLFVKIDWRERMKVFPIQGIVRFVQIGSHPCTVPEEQIEWVKTVLGYPELVERTPFLMAGDEVRVIYGPLAGVRGFVQRLEGRTRVVISLQCISRAISVEVNPAFVERIESPGGTGEGPAGRLVKDPVPGGHF